MKYINHYQSPIGVLLIAEDGGGLCGLWLYGEKYYAKTLGGDFAEKRTRTLDETKKWLDIYFGGRKPDFMPKLDMRGSAFRLEVWKILLEIPYGRTTTYGEIARKISARRGGKMSAQAVGGAVGHNEISIIVPCHRVIGSGGNLTGYAGGLDAKTKLLALEGIDVSKLALPRGSASAKA